MKKHSNLFVSSILGLFVIISCLNANAQDQKPELVIQTGHKKDSRIEKLALSSDDKILASAEGNTLKIWDVEKNKELRTIKIPGGEIVNLAFIPNNKGILTEGRNDRITLWDIETGEPVWTISKFNPPIAFSQDGALVAIGGDDHSLSILDGNTGVKLRNFKYSLETPAVASFSPDNKMICAADYTGQTQLLDAVSGAVIRTFPKQNSAVEYIGFSPKGNYLFVADNEKINIWEMPGGKLSKSIKKTDDTVAGGIVNEIAFSPDNQTFSVNGATDKMMLWTIAAGKPTVPLEKLPNDFIMIGKVVFGHRKNILIGSNFMGGINLIVWNLDNKKIISTLKGHTASIEQVAYSPSGKTIVSIGNLGSDSYSNRFGGTGWGRSVSFWSDIGQDFSTLKGRTQSATAAFSPDGDNFLTIETLESKNQDIPTVTQWDVKSSTEAKNFSELKMWSNYLFNSNGKYIAEISTDRGTAQIFEAQSGRAISKIDNQQKMLTTYNFSPDGKLFATSNSVFGDDSSPTIKVWDALTGKPVSGFSKGDPAKALAFSRNGTLLAAQFDKGFKVFQVSDGKEILSLEDVESDITGGLMGFPTSVLLFSPDNRLVAAVTRQRKKFNTKLQTEGDDLGAFYYQITIIDVANKKVVREFGDNSQQLWSMAFSPDGKYLVSGGDDGQTTLWEVSTGKELAKMITFDAKDWLVVTPEGLFDGSPNAWKQLMWRFDNNTFNYAPVEAYFNDFFYPNLLQEIMQGKRPLPPNGKNLSKIDRRRPSVNVGIEQAQSPLATRTVKVKVEVTDNADKPRLTSQSPTGGAQDVRLFRNGSLVKTWRGDVLKGKKTAILETEIPITAGDNNFTAYAFNRDNVKSDDGIFSVKGADSLKRDSVLYVLAIGVNNYANPAFNLRYTVADAQAVTDEIKRQQELLKIYSRTEVISLFDEKATKQGILDSIKTIKSKAQPEDAVVIYFSGHGMANEPRFYLIPHDLGYSGPRTKESLTQGLKDIYTHSLSDLEIENALEDLDAGMMLLIIDACNSGQALESEEKRRGPMNSKGLAQLAYEKGMYVLTASQSFEVAFESQSLKHSYLNFALIEDGLQSGKADNQPKDGNVMLREWLNFAVQRVPLMRQEQVNKSKDLIDEEQKTGGRVQQPRVFYRRENEATPIIIAKTNKQ